MKNRIKKLPIKESPAASYKLQVAFAFGKEQLADSDSSPLNQSKQQSTIFQIRQFVPDHSDSPVHLNLSTIFRNP